MDIKDKKLIEHEADFLNFLDNEGNIELGKKHALACKAYLIDNDKLNDDTDFCDCCNLPLPDGDAVKEYPLDCEIEEFSSLGVGVYLYFFYMKFLMLIFLIVFIVCGIPFIYTVNSYASDLEAYCSGPGSQNKTCLSSLFTDTKASGLFRYSYQPLEFYKEIVISLGKQNSWLKDDLFDWIFIVTLICLFSTHCLFLILVKNKIKVMDIHNLTISDYTVFVTQIKKNIFNIEDFKKEYLEGQDILPIDINFAYKLENFLKKKKEFMSLLKLKDKKIHQSAASSSELADTEIIKKMELIEAEMDEFYAKVQAEDNKKLQPFLTGSAFLTFETIKDRDDFISGYYSTTLEWFFKRAWTFIANCFSCFFSADYLKKLNDLFRFSIYEPSEPEDIIWRNLEYSALNIWVRKFITLLLSLIVIFICFVISVSLNLVKIEYASSKDAKDFYFVQSISMSISMSTVAINFIINKIVVLLTSYEKVWTSTEFNLSHALKNSILIFINTGLVPLAVQFYIRGKVDETSLSNDVLWILLFNAILTPAIFFMDMSYYATKYFQYSLEKKIEAGEEMKLTQQEVNDLFEKSSLNISFKFGYLAATSYLTLFYLPLFPMGVVVSFIGIVLMFWGEKYNLLRYYSRPRMISHHIGFFFFNLFKTSCFLTAVYS